MVVVKEDVAKDLVRDDVVACSLPSFPAGFLSRLPRNLSNIHLLSVDPLDKQLSGMKLVVSM
jgi:hypothetical protein